MPSQPVVLYADNFASYPVNSFPSGFTGGGSQVEPDPLGFYYRVCQMGPNQIFKDTGTLHGSATVYFGFCANSGQGVFMFSYANGPDALGNQTERICDLVIEADFSISCRRGTQIVGNSGQNNIYINPYGWNYVQYTISISTFMRPGDGVNCISVTCSLGLNGNTCFADAIGEFADLPVASMYYGVPEFNMFLFAGPNFNGGPIADVYLCQESELNVFPFDFDSMGNYLPNQPGYKGSNLLVTQAYAEICEDPDIGDQSETNLRVSQGFIEVVELPGFPSPPMGPSIEFPNLRISQAFIELMTESGSGPAPGGQGSRVYEA